MTPIPKCSVQKCKHHQIFAMGMCDKHYREWLAFAKRLEWNATTTEDVNVPEDRPEWMSADQSV